MLPSPPGFPPGTLNLESACPTKPPPVGDQERERERSSCRHGFFGIDPAWLWRTLRHGKCWPIEIDSLPNLKMGSFHGELFNNQMVTSEDIKEYEVKIHHFKPGKWRLIVDFS